MSSHPNIPIRDVPDRFASRLSLSPVANVPCGVRQTAGRRARVKGGQQAFRGQFPWSASVQLNGAHFCMGAVLSDEYVLTAAHCFVGKPSGTYTVTVGGHDLTAPEPGQVTVTVAEQIIHEKYHPGTFDNDIALLKLENKVRTVVVRNYKSSNQRFLFWNKRDVLSHLNYTCFFRISM